MVAGQDTPSKALQDFSCDVSFMGVDFVMEKDHFLYEQA
jgi:hypothetical protein